MTTVRERGASALTRWLEERGWSVYPTRRGRIDVLEARKGSQRRQIRWSTRTGGDWQTSIRYPPFDEDDQHEGWFWAFVDVSKDGPDVVVLPEHAVREAIADGHAEYLRTHGGNRPVTVDSTHFAVRGRMVEKLCGNDQTDW